MLGTVSLGLNDIQTSYSANLTAVSKVRVIARPEPQSNSNGSAKGGMRCACRKMLNLRSFFNSCLTTFHSADRFLLDRSPREGCLASTQSNDADGQRERRPNRCR